VVTIKGLKKEEDSVFVLEKLEEVVLILLNLCTWVTFFLPAIIGCYIQQVSKVELAVQFRKITYGCLVTMFLMVVGTITAGVVASINTYERFYTDPIRKVWTHGTDEKVEGLLLIYCLFAIPVYLLQLILMYLLWRESIKCEKALLAFHDFLVSYRQTPRSRLFKKHLPSMEPILEDESHLEKSATQSFIGAPESTAETKKTKFKYDDTEDTDSESDEFAAAQVEDDNQLMMSGHTNRTKDSAYFRNGENRHYTSSITTTNSINNAEDQAMIDVAHFPTSQS